MQHSDGLGSELMTFKVDKSTALAKELARHLVKSLHNILIHKGIMHTRVYNTVIWTHDLLVRSAALLRPKTINLVFRAMVLKTLGRVGSVFLCVFFKNWNLNYKDLNEKTVFS